MKQLELLKTHRDHVAIMTKSWKLIPKILSGGKTIESRWYKNKVAPWDRISISDTVYFKNAGEKISAKATVQKVLQFENLNITKIKELIANYNHGIKLVNTDPTTWNREVNYCILIFLKDAAPVHEPFNINKKGYGSAVAWLTVDSIDKIKL